MLIKVIEEDIERGNPKSRDCCPIALALLRQTGEHYFVGASYRHISEQETDCHHWPIECRWKIFQFIRQFDLYGCAEPFEFELPIETSKEARSAN